MPGTASIYNDIDNIKKEGNIYDKMMADAKNKTGGNWGTLQEWNNKYSRPVTPEETILNSPTYIGNDPILQGYGESKYDRLPYEAIEGTGRDLEDYRAERQSPLARIGAGVGNLTLTAATTFADSFIGTAVGLGNAALTGIQLLAGENEHPDIGAGYQILDSFANNPASLWLNDIQQKGMTDWMPTYTSQEYRKNAETSWWKNIPTTAFLSSALQNTGFTLGMAAAAMVDGNILSSLGKVGEATNLLKKGATAAINEGRIVGKSLKDVDSIVKKAITTGEYLKEIDAGQGLIDVAKAVSKRSNAIKMASTAIATTSEARMEGINNSNQYKQERQQYLESPEGQETLMRKALEASYATNPELFNYDPRTVSADQLAGSIRPGAEQAITQKYKEVKDSALKSINDAAIRVAATDFALNFPILYAGNMWQFGRDFAGGFKTQRSLWSNIKQTFGGGPREIALEGAGRIEGQLGKYAVNSGIGAKSLRLVKLLSNPLVEGNEEMMQNAASNIAQLHAGSQMNTFTGMKLDPHATEEVDSWFGAIAQGVSETYRDPFHNKTYMEGFMGLLTGALGTPNIGFVRNQATGKMNAWSGGVWKEFMEMKHETAELQQLADQINNAYNKNKPYYQGKARRDILEAAKLDALNSEDKFAFENSDHAQFISDMLAFSKAGKLQDFKDMINSNVDMYSNPDATERDMLGSEIRELAWKKNEKGEKTGEDVYKDWTNEQLVDNALEFNKSLKNKVDDYSNIARNLNAVLGDKMSEDGVEEMIYLFSQAKNLGERWDQLIDRVIENSGQVTASELNNKIFDVNTEGGPKKMTWSEILSNVKNGVISRQEFKEFLMGGRTGEWTENKKNVKGEQFDGNNFMQELFTANSEAKLKDNIQGAIEGNVLGAQQLVRDLVDLTRIEGARTKLVNLYNTYTNNPTWVDKNNQADIQKAEEAKATQAAQGWIDKVKAITNNPNITDKVGALKELVKNTQGKDKEDLTNAISKMSTFPDTNANFDKSAEEFTKIHTQIPNEFEAYVINNNIRPEEADTAREILNRVIDRSNSYSSAVSGVTDQDMNYDPMNPAVNAGLDQVRELVEDFMKDRRDYWKISQNTSNYNPQPGNNINTPPSTPTPPPGTTSTNEGEKPTEPQGTEKVQELNSVNTTLNNKEEEDIDTKKTEEQKKELDKQRGKPFKKLPYWRGGPIFKAYSPEYKLQNKFLKDSKADTFINEGNMLDGVQVHIISGDSNIFSESKGYKSYKEFLQNPDKFGDQEDAAYWAKNKDSEVRKAYLSGRTPYLMVVESPLGDATINGKSYQVVGVLANDLVPKKLSDEIAKSNISTTTIKVKGGQDGRLDFSNNENPLAKIVKKGFKLGISDDLKTISTGSNPSNRVPIKPFRATSTGIPGGVYLLVKGAKGNYIPAYCRVKPVSEVDLSANTPLFNELRDIVDRLTKVATNPLALSQAYIEQFQKEIGHLSNILFIGQDAKKFVGINQGPDGRVYADLNGKPIVSLGAVIEGVYTPREDKDAISKEFLQAFQNEGIHFQIKKSQINNKWSLDQTYDYNEVLSQAGILTTNLNSIGVSNGSFDTESLDENLEVVKPEPTKKNTPPTTSNPVGKPTIVEINIGSNTYNYNPSTGEVKTKEGVAVPAGLAKLVQFINTVHNLPNALVYMVGAKEIGGQGNTTYYAYNGKVVSLGDKNTIAEVKNATIISRVNSIVNNRLNPKPKQTSIADLMTEFRRMRDDIGQDKLWDMGVTSDKVEHKVTPGRYWVLQINNKPEVLKITHDGDDNNTGTDHITDSKEVDAVIKAYNKHNSIQSQSQDSIEDLLRDAQSMVRNKVNPSDIIEQAIQKLLTQFNKTERDFIPYKKSENQAQINEIRRAIRDWRQEDKSGVPMPEEVFRVESENTDNFNDMYIGDEESNDITPGGQTITEEHVEDRAKKSDKECGAAKAPPSSWVENL